MYSAIDNSIFLSIVTSSSGKMEMVPLAHAVCQQLLSAAQLSSLFLHRGKRENKGKKSVVEIETVVTTVVFIC